MSGGVGSSQRKHGGLSSQLRGRKMVENRVRLSTMLRTIKIYPLIALLSKNVIYEQYLNFEDFEFVDGFLGCLEAQGWLTAFDVTRIEGCHDFSC